MNSKTAYVLSITEDGKLSGKEIFKGAVTCERLPKVGETVVKTGRANLESVVTEIIHTITDGGSDDVTVCCKLIRYYV